MTRLEKLLYALTAVLIKYHNKNVRFLCERNHEEHYAQTVFSKLNDENNKALTDIVTACAAYRPNRTFFFEYLMHEIQLIRLFIDYDTKLNDPLLSIYVQLLATMFSQFKQLFTLDNTQSCTVYYSPNLNDLQKRATSTLYGCVYSGILKWNSTLCYSGSLLKDALKDLFNEYTAESDLQQCAQELCIEFNKTKEQDELSKKNQALENTVYELTQKQNETDQYLSKKDKKIKHLQHKVKALQQQLEQHEKIDTSAPQLAKPPTKSPFDAPHPSCLPEHDNKTNPSKKVLGIISSGCSLFAHSSFTTLKLPSNSSKSMLL